MPTIKFVRTERDCPVNKDKRADGDVRGIIYDFDVMIDGDRRAELKREYTGVGYALHDADGRPIGGYNRRGEIVAKKSDFEAIVAAFLNAGKIPTLAVLEELRVEEAAALDAKRAQAAKNMRESRIRDAGVDLYEALKLARAALNHPAGASVRERALGAAEAAVALAEATHESDAGQIEYEARHRL